MPLEWLNFARYAARGRVRSIQPRGLYLLHRWQFGGQSVSLQEALGYYLDILLQHKALRRGLCVLGSISVRPERLPADQGWFPNLRTDCLIANLNFTLQLGWLGCLFPSFRIASGCSETPSSNHRLNHSHRSARPYLAVLIMAVTCYPRRNCKLYFTTSSTKLHALWSPSACLSRRALPCRLAQTHPSCAVDRLEPGLVRVWPVREPELIRATAEVRATPHLRPDNPSWSEDS